ncbi:MAG: hypothetical protein KC621_01055, partial [Myxococcales bacterium]|nr:hypothetical protein [Myxococcales bacterium]
MHGLPVFLSLLQSCWFAPATPIKEALSRCERALPRKSKNPTGDMSLKRVETPNAHCNDGSPPAMFLRAATNPEHRQDWVVFLEGGGSCASNPGCQERWCGQGYFNATKMSSDFYDEREDGGGMMSSSPMNPFHDWNIVEMKYCSSDIWLG